MSKWQFYIVLSIGCCLGLTELRSQAQSSSQDAMTVRAIYAKLELASQLNEVRSRLVSPNAKPKSVNGAEALTGALHVVISDIKTGPLDDIRSVTLADLVTKPSGRTLLVTPSQWNFMTAGGETLHAMGAQVSWTQAPYLTEDWNIPVSRAIDMGVIDPAYSRYASVSARAIYQGEQRQYRALFLFSDDLEKQSAVLPLDHIVGLPALQTLSADQSVPETLLAQPFRTRPEVSNFIEWWRGQPGCSTDAYTGMCCDPSTGQCGISSRVLQTKNLGAIEPSSVQFAAASCGGTCRSNTSGTIGQYGDTDFVGHAQDAGVPSDHEAHIEFHYVCTYSAKSPCTGTCDVHLSFVQTVERGPVTSACHVLTTFGSGTTTPAGGGPCSNTWGYTVRACNLCTCGVSSPVIHTWEHTAQWTCPL
jgi:hypothetical protein